MNNTLDAVAQLMVVEYNGRHNAYGGDRDKNSVIDIFDVKMIKRTIVKYLKLLSNGYVLVRYQGKTFLCEKNNVNPEEPYLRHETFYHPLDKLFTV